MSKSLVFDFSMHEPAMAISNVFSVLAKKARPSFDITSKFSTSIIRWSGSHVLGIVEQSVFLSLLSAANQQNFGLSQNPREDSVGAKLLPLMKLQGMNTGEHLKVVRITWNQLLLSLGYSSHGRKIENIVSLALTRLAETTIQEETDGEIYKSRVLAWVVGDDGVINIALNRRASNSLRGGQFVKISLSERRQLPDERSKCLHAWLSASLRPGTTRAYVIDSLQRHVWGDVKADTALRSRRMRLRDALQNIDALESWTCTFISKDKVEIRRLPTGLTATK